MSWYDLTKYLSIARDKRESEDRDQEMEWARIRALWVPLMTSVFKKKGGGQFEPTDLITLSFDKKDSAAPATLETFEALVAKHGKRKKRGIK